MSATLLLVAFHPEWDALLPHVADAAMQRVIGKQVVIGRIGNSDVILAETGVSMVNAAMTAQALIDRFAPARVVVSGIGGGIDPALAIGTVVAPARWGQFLEVGFGRESSGGFTLPPLPGETELPPFAMLLPRDVVMPDGAMRWIEADAGLLAVAAATDPNLVVGGRAMSGSAFVDNAAYRAYLHAVFGAQLVDMESAAVAQVALANDVPFIAFRAVSDLAGGEADESRFPAFMTHAAETGAALVRAFLRKLEPVHAR